MDSVFHLHLGALASPPARSQPMLALRGALRRVSRFHPDDASAGAKPLKGFRGGDGRLCDTFLKEGVNETLCDLLVLAIISITLFFGINVQAKDSSKAAPVRRTSASSSLTDLKVFPPDIK